MTKDKLDIAGTRPFHSYGLEVRQHFFDGVPDGRSSKFSILARCGDANVAHQIAIALNDANSKPPNQSSRIAELEKALADGIKIGENIASAIVGFIPGKVSPETAYQNGAHDAGQLIASALKRRVAQALSTTPEDKDNG